MTGPRTAGILLMQTLHSSPNLGRWPGVNGSISLGTSTGNQCTFYGNGSLFLRMEKS